MFLSAEDRKDFHEDKNPYYKYIEKKTYCEKILHEFNISNDKAIIINGHIPVKVTEGQSPIKAEGKYIIIDGGLTKAYHSLTGIAGYTLVYNSHGLKLIAHNVFTTKDDSIMNNIDISHEVQRITLYSKRMSVRDSYVGKQILANINDLEQLLKYYKEGTIKTK